MEPFFKWIKQHLRINAFFGTSENAVKTQVWISVSVYVLVVIVRKCLALGVYLMRPEHDDASTRSVEVNEPHYQVLPEFRNASYAKRYEIFCEKAFREGLYDATAFLMSNKAGGLKGEYIEPSEELSFKKLAAAIYGRAVAYCKQR